jgi:8-oxo-dGTP pyrophosphatase MutT (NUDIX family)
MSDAIPAATLVSWRDLDSGPEILVVERASTMAFAAGAVVFPGGRVDEEDRQLAAALGQADQAAKVTAIRETLEESAIPTGLRGVGGQGQAEALQRDLIQGRSFADLLAGHGLALELEALTPFARWMPAFKQPRKFDTLFYVAAAPEGDWTPLPQPGECVLAEWQAPTRLVEEIAGGKRSAIFPTKRNLERLAQHDRLAAMVEDATSHSIDTIVPWIEEIDGEPHVRIPENRGYPVLWEPLKTAFRA